MEDYQEQQKTLVNGEQPSEATSYEQQTTAVDAEKVIIDDSAEITDVSEPDALEAETTAIDETAKAANDVEPEPSVIADSVEITDASEPDALKAETTAIDETAKASDVESEPSVIADSVENIDVSEPDALEAEAIATDEKERKNSIKKVTRQHLSKNASIPVEQFDWDTLENDDLYEGNKTEIAEQYNQTLSKIAENEIVEGTVVAITKREVIVNIGYKSEGVIGIAEFRYNPDLKVGDKVEVYVETTEDKRGQLILSHKQARALRSWDRVNEALANDEIIKGYIKCRTKGGMIVDVFGIEAFLPGSQIDVKPIRDYDMFVDKTMEFKVVKINPEFRNVVISHKALIEAEIEAQKKEIISHLEKGQVLEGTVKNITSYGVFIDLGGVDGLIHITDLSWGRVTHPEEVVTLDEKVNVVILDFDNDKKRIALGIKQLTPHPWDSLDANLKVGDKVKGKVVVMADYGAFIEISLGVEGLIHVSEMSWSQHLRSAQDFMKVGDEVEAVILTIDRDERKMSLGIKQLKDDPWINIEAKYAIGSKHVAKVRNFTNFGIFVEIEEGVDGLIHISDLSWTKKIKHPAEFTQIGAMIDVQVLEIDKENRRLSLGHKQLEENPWDVFESLFTVESIHEGTITEMSDKGALISLSYGVEGFAPAKGLKKQDGTMAKVEERLPFKVTEFAKAAKKIIVSHTRVFEDEQKDAEIKEKASNESTTKDAIKKVQSSIEKTTLGDVEALAALRDEMENQGK